MPATNRSNELNAVEHVDWSLTNAHMTFPTRSCPNFADPDTHIAHRRSETPLSNPPPWTCSNATLIECIFSRFGVWRFPLHWRHGDNSFFRGSLLGLVCRFCLFPNISFQAQSFKTITPLVLKLFSFKNAWQFLVLQQTLNLYFWLLPGAEWAEGGIKCFFGPSPSPLPPPSPFAPGGTRWADVPRWESMMFLWYHFMFFYISFYCSNLQFSPSPPKCAILETLIPTWSDSSQCSFRSHPQTLCRLSPIVPPVSAKSQRVDKAGKGLSRPPVLVIPPVFGGLVRSVSMKLKGRRHFSSALKISHRVDASPWGPKYPGSTLVRRLHHKMVISNKLQSKAQLFQSVKNPENFQPCGDKKGQP